MSETARRMLVRGMAAARAGDHAEAQRYLERVLFNDATRAQLTKAHLWLSRITSDPSEQREHIEEVLAADPTHAEAQRALAILDGRLDPADIVDPDHLPQPHADPEALPQPALAQRWICPKCAGRVRFEPGKSWVECQYCGHRQPVLTAQRQHSQLEEHNFLTTLATAKGHTLPAGTRAYHCEGCQATLLTSGTFSTNCPYCGSAHLLEDDAAGTIAPAGIIPFTLNKHTAAEALRTWLDRELGKRTTHTRTTRPRGLYLPMWTFDLMGEIGWREIERESGNYPRRATLPGKTLRSVNSHSQRIDAPNSLEGSDYLILDDVVVPATHQVPYTISDVFASFNLDLAVPYDPAYLTDWPAERYAVRVSDASLVARRQALDKSRKDIHTYTMGGTGVPPQNLQVFSRSLAVQAYKLLLLPIWLAHYRHQADAYAVVINGQNGQAFGETPPRGLRRLIHRWHKA